MGEKAKGPDEKGSIRIQRSYRGVGRIRVRSGKYVQKDVDRIVNALDEFHRANNLHVLKMVKNGDLSPEAALEAFTSHGANHRPSTGGSQLLLPAMESWLKTHDVKEATRKSYQDHLKQFAKVINQSHEVSDIGVALTRFKAECAKDDRRQMFRVVSFMCRAFVGVDSPLYLDVLKVKKFAEKAKKERTWVDVIDIRLLTALLPPQHAASVWSMCCSGMRRTEFFELNDATWTLSRNRVIVNGTKTTNSRREVFRAFPVKKPTTKYQALQRAITTAYQSELAKGLPMMSFHSFRKTFRHWCEEAGILRSHIQVYGGWSAQTMLDLYGAHTSTSNIESDTKLFEKYLANKGVEQVNPNASQFFETEDDIGTDDIPKRVRQEWEAEKKRLA